MPVGKRWSWPCRLGVLFVLTLPLQGCNLVTSPITVYTYYVPGISGQVYPTRQTSSDGRHYYGVRWNDQHGNAPQRDRVVYEGSREYEIIDRFFRNLNKPQAAGDRSGVPGGSGTLPPPAVQ